MCNISCFRKNIHGMKIYVGSIIWKYGCNINRYHAIDSVERLQLMVYLCFINTSV